MPDVSPLGVPQKAACDNKDGAPQAAGVVFVAPDGDVLLLLRSATEENYASHWALPGGKADGAETAEQAADREIKEEIGNVPPGPMKLLDRRDTPNGMVYSTFARPVETKFAPVLNDEHAGYAWTPLDKLPRPLHPAVANTLGAHIGVADDMTPEDWDGLRSGFAKWTREEEQEAEHRPTAADEAITDTVGRKHYDRVPISKANICEYRGNEIPKWQDLGLEPTKLYRMLRDPDELAKAASTFNGIQLLYKHVPVSADDHRPDDIVGTTGTAAEFEHPYLYNALSVWAQYAIDGIDDKTRHELSSSYHYDADMTPGKFEGQPHDGVMRNLHGNHVMVCKDGRAGPDVALDEAPHKPIMETHMAKKAILMSRTATRALAALSVLAMDSKIDFSPALKGLTAKNLKTRKAGLVKSILAMDGMEEAMAPAAAASGATPDDVIMKVLSMVEGQTAAEPPEADEVPEASTDPNAGPPAAAGGQMDMGKLKAWLATKGMGEDDMSELDGMMGDPGEDEEEDETPEAKAARLAKEKGAMDNEPMVSKTAMDAALKSHGDTILRTQREITQATAYVRPWVGELAMDESIGCATDVYRKALTSLGVSGAAGMHADALKSVLDVQAKPGDRKVREVVAMDSAAEKSLAERFPHAASISNLG